MRTSEKDCESEAGERLRREVKERGLCESERVQAERRREGHRKRKNGKNIKRNGKDLPCSGQGKTEREREINKELKIIFAFSI